MARPLPILSLIMLTGSGCQRSSLPGRDPSPGLSASTASATPSPATSPPGASAPPASFASPGLHGHHHDVDAPELVHFDGRRGRLGGFLYKPRGPGPISASAPRWTSRARRWRGPTARPSRRACARRHGTRAPVFFAQAANDCDTRPSLELAKEMDSAGKPHALRIFPARGSTAEEGHAFCSGGMQPEWGDDVLAFFAENGIEGKPQLAAHVPSP